MGYRHTSILAGIKAITTLALQKGWNVTATEDANLFTDDFLSRFDVAVFLNTTGNILEENQEKSFTAFIKSGKGFVGMKAFTIEDEWYSFKENPCSKVTVLATLDETTITKLPKDDAWRMGDHPVIWYHEFEGAHAFYTVFGHGDTTFENATVQQHPYYAIEWAWKRINL